MPCLAAVFEPYCASIHCLNDQRAAKELTKITCYRQSDFRGEIWPKICDGIPGGNHIKAPDAFHGGKLPFPLACEAIEKAGGALDMIHRQAGIFHRDISPENIMVMPDGTIKIIDFGSAKLMSVSENQQFSVVLKPGFAPPEQYASNLSQGSFNDVYALAGTFYYAASGRMIPVAPDRLMGAEIEGLDRLVPECSQETAAAVDSRIYLLRKGQMLCPVPAHNYRLLLDSMLAEGSIDREKCEKELPRAEALISFLGVGGVDRMEVNPNPFRLEEGDRVLLCSDGLYKSLPDRRVRVTRWASGRTKPL